jgi:hypothetical protein
MGSWIVSGSRVNQKGKNAKVHEAVRYRQKSRKYPWLYRPTQLFIHALLDYFKSNYDSDDPLVEYLFYMTCNDAPFQA